MYTDGSNYKKSAYGTISYLPAAFGGVCASVVIRNLMHDHSHDGPKGEDSAIDQAED